jgi:SAM-dependent methyltransferase
LCGAAARRSPEGVYFFLSEDDTQVAPALAKDPTEQASWSKWRTRNFAYLQQKLAAKSPESVILDLGAGAGYFRELYEGQPYIGLDFRPYEGVNVVTDLTKRLPLTAEAADYAVLSNTLEHVPEPEFVLAECHRVLRPSGAVLIVVPFLARVHQPPYDFLRYTGFMLDYLLEKVGFRDADVEDLGDIFDVHAGLLKDMSILLRKNAEQRLGPEAARDIRKRSIAPFTKTVERELAALRELCGDDSSVFGEKRYPQGYGAVAYK